MELFVSNVLECCPEQLPTNPFFSSWLWVIISPLYLREARWVTTKIAFWPPFTVFPGKKWRMFVMTNHSCQGSCRNTKKMRTCPPFTKSIKNQTHAPHLKLERMEVSVGERVKQREISYLAEYTSPETDWLLIVTRIEIFLLQIEILKISDFSISLISAIFSWKLAEMAKKGNAISQPCLIQRCWLTPHFTQNRHISIAHWNIEHSFKISHF